MFLKTHTFLSGYSNYNVVLKVTFMLFMSPVELIFTSNIFVYVYLYVRLNTKLTHKTYDLNKNLLNSTPWKYRRHGEYTHFNVYVGEGRSDLLAVTVLGTTHNFNCIGIP